MKSPVNPIEGASTAAHRVPLNGKAAQVFPTSVLPHLSAASDQIGVLFITLILHFISQDCVSPAPRIDQSPFLLLILGQMSKVGWK